MSDSYDKSILEDTLHDSAEDDTNFDFINKKVLVYRDINQGSYPANTIDMDLGGAAGNNLYIDWLSAYLHIPMVLEITATAGIIGQSAQAIAEQVFAASFKNNHCNLINSMRIEMNNNELVGTKNFNNLMCQYDMLSSYSLDAVDNYGSVLNFSKLSPESQSFNATIGQSGLGSVNTSINEAVFDTSANPYDLANKGRRDRMKTTSFYPGSTANAEMLPANYLSDTARDGVVISEADKIVYQVMAKIPMAQLHPWFEKVGMVRNSNYRMIFNTNINSTATLTIDSGGNLTKTEVSSPNQVLPFQLSPLNAGLPVKAGTAGTIVAKLSIVKGANHSHPITQCTMNLPMYQMKPALEDKYLSQRVKKVVFKDYTVFSGGNFQGIGPSGLVNTHLTNGLNQIRKIIIMPFYSQNRGTVVDGNGTDYSVMNSPWADEPSTLCSPYCPITDFNVQLGGVNIYPQDIKFGYQHFLHEIHNDDGSVTSGLNPGCSSGLINEETYATYPFVVVNIARKVASQDFVTESINLSFKNGGKRRVDYLVFVEHMRTVAVDKATGLYMQST